ncbi:MAG: translation initiation factor IF-2 N-terminal domain-containing protein, partial [Nocardiaceae bacterium]|nr:translation initiation factor IF-2 N-terminal domain-containing protein [Nocardiaceae bacterium]
MAEQAPPESVQEPIAEASVETGTTPVLPEKIRVHALAKLLGVTSKQVLAEAAALGTELRSAQSSLQRDIAERIHATMSGSAEPETPVTEAPATEAPATGAPAAEPAVEQAPAEEAAEKPEKPAPRKRARKKAAPKAKAEPVAEPTAVNEPEPAPAVAETGTTGAGLFTDAELGAEHKPEQPAAAPATMQAPLFLQPETPETVV